MILTPVYKQALAHSAGRDNDVSLGLAKVIEELNSILTIGSNELKSVNMHY